jgi:hypothetical protein
MSFVLVRLFRVLHRYPNNTFANYTSDWIHNTTITGLSPGTTYAYVINGTFAGTFTTAPVAGALPSATAATAAEGSTSGSSATGAASSTRPLVVSVVGDLGQTTDSFRTLKHMMQDPGTPVRECCALKYSASLPLSFGGIERNAPMHQLLCSLSFVSLFFILGKGGEGEKEREQCVSALVMVLVCSLYAGLCADCRRHFLFGLRPHALGFELGNVRAAGGEAATHGRQSLD